MLSNTMTGIVHVCFRAQSTHGNQVQGTDISDDVSRCYSDGSSLGASEEHVREELTQRLEVQQKSSAFSRYRDLVAEINTNLVRVSALTYSSPQEY